MARDDEWFGRSWWARQFHRYLETGHTANAKALHLLVTHLTPLELECFTKYQLIPVIDSKGVLWALYYSAAPSRSAVLIGYGVTCWYPGYDQDRAILPRGDVVLGQKYALETGKFYEWRSREGFSRPLLHDNQEQTLRRDNSYLLPYYGL